MERIYRIIDANINRASEGSRVIEDILRFLYNDNILTEKMRLFRHRLRDSLKELDDKLTINRDSNNDIGIEISFSSKIDDKKDIKQLVKANFVRIEEAARTIEESLKIVSKYEISKEIENIRFLAYILEKEVICKISKPLIPLGLYGITAENFSYSKSNIKDVHQMCKAGIKIIQYREKHKSIKEKLIECREIRKITKDYGVIFIVNDHLEIAMLSDACGLHLGQDDLDICDARKLIPNMIIGKSTHSISDAEKAVIDGADYIGVGPIYKTNTKEREPVGLEYLSYAVKNIKIPFIAIGGIKEHNLEEIVSYGAERISLVSDIVESKNIVEKINSLKNIIMKRN